MTEKPFAFTEFGRDFDGWDIAEGGNGEPGIGMFASALQVWAICQADRISVRRASEAFRVTPVMIIEAVEEFAWMDLQGPPDDFDKLMIVHDGE